MSDKVETFYNDLIKNHTWIRNKDELNSTWNNVNKKFNDYEKLIFLKKLSEDNYIFRWLDLISYIIPLVKYDEDIMIEIIKNITIKVKNDMAQGNYIRGLIKIGENDQNRAFNLYNKLQCSSDDVIQYSGLILGGIGKQNYDYMFNYIITNFSDSNEKLKASYLKAIRVSNENKDTLIYEKEIFKLIDSVIFTKNEYLLYEVIQICFDFNKYNSSKTEEYLLYYTLKGNDSIKYIIANKLWFYNLSNYEIEIKLIEILSKENDIKILDEIAKVLSRKGSNYLIQSLTIIKYWVDKNKFYDISNIKYCLNELGKENTEIGIDFIEKWILDYNEVEIRNASYMMATLINNYLVNNTLTLIFLMDKWINSGKYNLRIIIIHMIDDLLVFNKQPDDMIDKTFKLLKKLSKEDVYYEDTHGLFVSIFGSRPLFTNPKKIIQIIKNWSNSKNKNTRKCIVSALIFLAEYKIDTEETMRMIYNKDTRESKIKDIYIKKIENKESIIAYNILNKMMNDEDEQIRKLATIGIEQVDKKINEKESYLNNLPKKGE